MKVAVVGKGGREHAIAWKLKNDGCDVFAIPGNPGIAQVAECIDIPMKAVAEWCRDRAIELLVIGPEAPLCEGLADEVRGQGIPVFGPGQDGAQLEGSKSFSKIFFQEIGLATAPFFVCHSSAEVAEALKELGDEVVVKADGLAAGKGVVVCSNHEQATEAAAAMFGGEYGPAGKIVVVEKRIRGREVSVLAITDGKSVSLLPSAEDHKAIFDGDEGPNTGGMGTVSPGWVQADFEQRVRRDFFEPTIAGLNARGIDYRGVLYAGFMIDADGKPWILEYNCRFGDPETQVILPRLTGHLGELLLAAAKGQLLDDTIAVSPRASVCVVLASGGYPESSTHDVLIEGVSEAEAEGAVIFHAGTKLEDGLRTAGGRVLGVMAMGDTVFDARTMAYESAAKISFEGKQLRTDIGARGANL